MEKLSVDSRFSDIEYNIKTIKERICNAAVKSGRNENDVRLMAVTKTVEPVFINHAIANGIDLIGENKVQEFLSKKPYLNLESCEAHLIGHLQTNKVKYIIDKVSMIHSVDSLKLAQEIDKRAAQHNLTMDILIQVNSAMEESKFGITTEETGQLIRDILDTCPNVRLRGMMCIAPFEDNPEDARVYFEQVKALYDEYGKMDHPNLDFRYLSMGMSNDYEIAVEEGSTMVRVGLLISFSAAVIGSDQKIRLDIVSDLVCLVSELQRLGQALASSLLTLIVVIIYVKACSQSCNQE